jgi:hypothetical protein
MSPLAHKLRSYGKVLLRTRYREVPDLVRLLARRPALMAAVGTYEGALLASGKVEGRLKALAQIKTGALIGCPF